MSECKFEWNDSKKGRELIYPESEEDDIFSFYRHRGQLKYEYKGAYFFSFPELKSADLYLKKKSKERWSGQRRCLLSYSSGCTLYDGEIIDFVFGLLKDARKLSDLNITYEQGIMPCGNANPVLGIDY